MKNGILRILQILKFVRRKVLVHTPTGDLILPVHRGNIIRVPWMCGFCPFRLEPDGAVTLRLMWGREPASGYGRIWESITWEELKK